MDPLGQIRIEQLKNHRLESSKQGEPAGKVSTGGVADGTFTNLKSTMSQTSQSIVGLRADDVPASNKEASKSLLNHQREVALETTKPFISKSLLENLSQAEKARLQELVQKSMASAKALSKAGPSSGTPSGEWTRVGEGDQSYEQRTVPADDGGPAWTEVRHADGRVTRTRSVPDSQGGPPWTEVDRGNGDTYKNRRYVDSDGREWSETILGDNRWRQNTNAEELARQRGPNTVLTVAGPNGPLEIPIYGGTPEEVEAIRRQLELLPPEMRVNVRQVTIADNIGQILNPDGSVKEIVAGFGGRDGIIIDRTQMSDAGATRHVLYHEMGHVQDYNNGDLSMRPPWGDGNGVSAYGRTNAREDYAEAHREVMELIARRGELAGTQSDIMNMSKDEIRARFPHGERYILILENYGHKFPENKPPESGGAPPGGNGCPPGGIGFPPGGIGFPPGGIGCPPGGIGFPPGGIGFPPGGIGFPPGGIGFPPGGIGFPPGGIGFPPGGIGFPPGGIGFHPRSTQQQLLLLQLMMMQQMLQMMLLMQMQTMGFPSLPGRAF